MKVDTMKSMHAGADIPSLPFQTSMKDAIYEISSKKLGMAVVVDENSRVLGVITDGDLRRLLERHGGAILEKPPPRGPESA